MSLDTDVLGEQGIEALSVGAIEVNITISEVITAIVEAVRNLGDVLGEVVGVGSSIEGEYLGAVTIVNVNAVTYMLGIDHVAIHIGGGQGEVEAAVTTLVTAVNPVVGGGVSGNGGNEVNHVTEGLGLAILVAVSDLETGPTLVIAVDGHHTGNVAPLGELGVDVTLGVEQVDGVVVDHEVDLGGALVNLGAHVVVGLAGLLVNTVLIDVTATPNELHAILSLVAPGQVLASGDADEDALLTIGIGTLYPGVVAVVPPSGVLDVNLVVSHVEGNSDLAVGGGVHDAI